MLDLHEKLRRFRANWITCAAKVRAVPAQVLGSAAAAADEGDAPALWVGQVAAFPPIAEVAAARRGLPRFAYLATQDEGQLAA
jgi:hypothetical protein